MACEQPAAIGMPQCKKLILAGGITLVAVLVSLNLHGSGAESKMSQMERDKRLKIGD